MLLVILMAKELSENYTKNCEKQIKREFRIEKVIKRKGAKLYVKWKSYDNLFNSWIDKNDIII